MLWASVLYCVIQKKAERLEAEVLAVAPSSAKTTAYRSCAQARRRSSPLAAIAPWRRELARKLATGEGMDKSTLIHTQIQIIIIHFSPSPIPPVPNG
jgi:hypothetical protein